MKNQAGLQKRNSYSRTDKQMRAGMDGEDFEREIERCINNIIRCGKQSDGGRNAVALKEKSKFQCDLSRLYREKSWRYSKNEDKIKWLSESIKVCDDILRYFPDDNFAILEKANALREWGKIDSEKFGEAEKLYIQVLERWYSNEIALDGLFIINQEKGNFDIALEYLMRLVYERSQNKKFVNPKKIKSFIDSLTEKRKQDELQERYAEVGQIAGRIGHEIKQPLTVIQTSLDIIDTLHEQKNEDEYEYQLQVGRIKDEIKEIDEIAEAMRIVVTKSTTKFEQISLKKLIEKTFDKNSDKLDLSGKGIQKAIEINEDLKVSGNEVLLETVFVNLIRNAVDALAGIDHPKIIVTATEQDENILISFSDNGVGIPPENMTKIFTPYFTTKKEMGTGLGLSTIKSIIELHGGKIAAQSKKGEETTFRILFRKQI
jgi:signal transduction histidine kinase